MISKATDEDLAKNAMLKIREYKNDRICTVLVGPTKLESNGDEQVGKHAEINTICAYVLNDIVLVGTKLETVLPIHMF